MKVLILTQMAIFGLIFSGCVHVPKQTAALSAKLSGQIAEAKRSHLALIDEYIHQRRERAEDFLTYVWTPRFIKNLLKKIKFDKAVCNVKGEMDRALVVQDLVSAISRKVEEKRREIASSIDEVERDLRAKVRDHYAHSERMSRAVTSNLQSVVRGQELQREIMKTLSLPTDKVVPLKEASYKLDQLLKLGE